MGRRRWEAANGGGALHTRPLQGASPAFHRKEAGLKPPTRPFFGLDRLVAVGALDAGPSQEILEALRAAGPWEARWGTLPDLKMAKIDIKETSEGVQAIGPGLKQQQQAMNGRNPSGWNTSSTMLPVCGSGPPSATTAWISACCAGLASSRFRARGTEGLREN